MISKSSYNQVKKILYVVTQSEFGGAQRYIADLASHFADHGYQVSVAAGENGELFARLAHHTIATHRLKHLLRAINPRQDLSAFFELKRLIKDIRPDILHLNSSKAGVLGAIAGRLSGVKKIIYTVHGFVFNEPLSAWQKTLYRWAERFSAHYKDHLICVSEFDRQTALKLHIAPARKLLTIHNGVSQPAMLDRSQSRRQLNIASDALVIGTISHLYPTKGLTDLLEAAKAVARENRQVLFVIIGDGEQRKLLEAKIKNMALTANVIITGHKQAPYQYLAAFDLYVCSSVKEGFPYSLLYAMSAQLPIVSTNVGGIPEMINSGQAGLLVKPGQPQQLAEAIRKIISDKKLAGQLGRQAKIDVNTKCSQEKMMTATERIYLA